MRELGKAFVKIVGGKSPVKRLIDGTRPRERYIVADIHGGPARKHRAWVVWGFADTRPHEAVIVLEDGRVGHPPWSKCYPGMGTGGTSRNTHEYHEWVELAWSPDLEEKLATWLSEHGITAR